MTKQVLKKGDARRLSDGRNAWRKMTLEQRAVYLEWIADSDAAWLVSNKKTGIECPEKWAVVLSEVV